MTRLPGRLRQGHCLTSPRPAAADRDRSASCLDADARRLRLGLLLLLLLLWILTFRGPLRSGGGGGSDPKGAAHRCAAFSARAGCPLGKSRRLRERSEEHTSELQSLMRISYAVFCLKKKKQ